MKCRAVRVGPSSILGAWAVQGSAYLQCWSATDSARLLVNSSDGFSACLQGCSSGAFALPFPWKKGPALSAWVETGTLGHNLWELTSCESYGQTACEGEGRPCRGTYCWCFQSPLLSCLPPTFPQPSGDMSNTCSREEKSWAWIIGGKGDDILRTPLQDWMFVVLLNFSLLSWSRFLLQG